MRPSIKILYWGDNDQPKYSPHSKRLKIRPLPSSCLNLEANLYRRASVRLVRPSQFKTGLYSSRTGTQETATIARTSTVIAALRVGVSGFSSKVKKPLTFSMISPAAMGAIIRSHQATMRMEPHDSGRKQRTKLTSVALGRRPHTAKRQRINKTAATHTFPAKSCNPGGNHSSMRRAFDTAEVTPTYS